jgi:hypothetical protein
MRSREGLALHVEALLPFFILEFRQRLSRWDEATRREFTNDLSTILCEAGDLILFGGYRRKKVGKGKAESHVPEYQRLLDKWAIHTPTNALLWSVAALVELSGMEVPLFAKRFGGEYIPESEGYAAQLAEALRKLNTGDKEGTDE